MKLLLCAVAFVAAIMLPACGPSIHAVSGPATPGAIDPAIQAVMTKSCASLPLVAAGGADTKGSWSVFNDPRCGDKGWRAGAASTTPIAPVAAGADPRPWAMLPLLSLPGQAKALGGAVVFVIDKHSADKKTRKYYWRIVPKDWFGVGDFDSSHPYNEASDNGTPERVTVTGNASQQTMDVRLDLRAEEGLEFSGWSGQVRL